MKAKRFDQGKSKVELIEPDFLLEVGHVLRMGAEKYDADNWKRALGTPEQEGYIKRIHGSMLRHAMQLAKGEALDEESGYHHAAHIACNAMFLYWYYQNGR